MVVWSESAIAPDLLPYSSVGDTPKCHSVQIKPPGELRLSEDVDEQEYCRARLLQPAGLPAYAAQHARADAQAAKPEQAAGEDVPGGGASEEPSQAAVKSEQQEGAGLMERARSTVGGLGRVKVPRGGFKQ